MLCLLAFGFFYCLSGFNAALVFVIALDLGSFIAFHSKKCTDDFSGAISVGLMRELVHLLKQSSKEMALKSKQDIGLLVYLIRPL